MHVARERTYDTPDTVRLVEEALRVGRAGRAEGGGEVVATAGRRMARRRRTVRRGRSSVAIRERSLFWVKIGMRKR